VVGKFWRFESFVGIVQLRSRTVVGSVVGPPARGIANSARNPLLPPVKSGSDVSVEDRGELFPVAGERVAGGGMMLRVAGEFAGSAPRPDGPPAELPPAAAPASEGGKARPLEAPLPACGFMTEATSDVSL